MIKNLICKLFGMYTLRKCTQPHSCTIHTDGWLSKKLNALDAESIFPLK